MKNIFVSILMSCAFVGGCTFFGIGKKKPDTGSSEEASTEETSSVSPGSSPQANPTDSKTKKTQQSFALSQRLTPEQITRQMEQATGYRLGWVDGQNEFHDVILESFNVSLGGVDFDAASERDRLTKVQTVLLVRTIAWSFAKLILWKESEKQAADRSFFTFTEPFADVPSEGPAKERWQAQVTEIYWRFFARAPSSDELEAVRNTFMDLRAAYPDKQPWEKNFMAWAGVLYSLLSTIEFWSI